MAILDSLPGVEITVVVDGEDLHEYQDTDMEDEEDTITKYVEAVTDATFAIKIKGSKRVTYKGDCLSFHVSVDGSSIEWPMIFSEATKVEDHIRIVEGVYVRDGYLRKPKFNALETVTEHGFGLPEDLARAESLGSIRVVVTHAVRTSIIDSVHIEPEDDTGIISEKAIKGKAMTHSYSLEEETENDDPLEFWDTDPVAGVKDPAGVYVFHYRSKGMTRLHRWQNPYFGLLLIASLRDLMIVPRTPSPVPLRERPVDTLSEAEKAELIKQLLAETANNVRVNQEIKKEVKRELVDGEDDNPRAHKRARPSIGPIHLELNDDDTFTETAVINKEKERDTIALD
ncbi:hypothetical protein D6D19_09493 [Aureobasidium pullulans]|uniref:DUF7918 domain-containing protein n=1 Tax=Aureobasidium pullulans TaxID=5580 RepID=A0A4S8ZF98_AURPU|nr:hypothetical protein D6D19_09493 [Aureobasidium pullulans]